LRKLILHIGGHKTGSSSIQQALLNNTERLATENYTFFAQAPNGQAIKNGNTSWWLDCNPATIRQQGAKLLNRERFASMLSRGDGDRIISAEAFSWVFSQQELVLLQQSLAKYFDEIRIVTYIRRQDRLAVSHYNQAVNNPFSAAYKFYQNGEVPLPQYREHHALYLDYHLKLNKWAQAFGWENLVIKVYDDIKEQGLIRDFFNLINIEYSGGEVHENSANHLTKIKVMQIMNELNLDYNLRFHMKYLPECSDKYLPSKQEAMDYLSHFIESNSALNRHLQLTTTPALFDNNFSEYPQETNHHWNEAITKNMLKNMLLAFNKSFSELSSLTLDAADKLALVDPVASQQIYKALLKSRPLDRDLEKKIHGSRK
jgi:hypothetical protein